jgi:predicted molibdopterin-dependent oxidoreductase YjgC
VAGLATAFGSGAMSNSMDDVANHAAALFIIGSNTTEQHPVFGTMLRRAVIRRKVPLVVADPRRIDITEFAALHLQLKPGTDIALLNGLMNIVLEKGWEDTDFISRRTEGFEDFRPVVEEYPPNRVAEITGVPVGSLYQAAEILATNKPMAVMWAMGITQHTVGVNNVMSLANLQMLLGNVGVPGGGVNPLRGQNNVQGACDLGGLPNVYPGYQAVTREQSRAKFEAAWGAPMSGQVGMTVTEMIPGILDGKIKALYILAEDPAMSDPNSNHARHCLEACDFIVLQEIFPTETAAYADVLLPGASFAEKTGTFTNTERRVQLGRQAIEPLGGARADWRIIADLAQRVLAGGERQVNGGTYAGWEYDNAAQIMAEVAALTPSYAGISHERLERGERLQWPVVDATHPGTPILHVGQFARGRGKFTPIDHVPPAELPDDEYPMLLTTGRVLYHWHGGEITRRARGLLDIYRQALVEVNPDDAQRMDIRRSPEDTGSLPGAGIQRVRVTSRRGSIEALAWVTDRVPPGVIHANFHFPGASANVLTIDALDPVAKIPEYKVCAVRVEKV